MTRFSAALDVDHRAALAFYVHRRRRATFPGCAVTFPARGRHLRVGHRDIAGVAGFHVLAQALARNGFMYQCLSWCPQAALSSLPTLSPGSRGSAWLLPRRFPARQAPACRCTRPMPWPEQALLGADTCPSCWSFLLCGVCCPEPSIGGSICLHTLRGTVL